MYDNFSISLDGLRLGEHKFQFLLDNSFFESLGYSLIESGNLEVDLLLNKKERLFELVLNFNGYVNLTCDRCGDPFKQNVHFTDETVLKLGEESYEDEGLIVVNAKDSVYDISHYLYETLCLSLPAKKVHPETKGDNSCNPEAIKKLEDYSKQIENKAIDSRWEALAKLNKN